MDYSRYRCLFIITIFALGISMVNDGYGQPQSYLEPLNEFSSNPVLLRWHVTPSSVTETPTIYARLIEGKRTYSWQEAITTPASASNEVFFQSMHKTELNFRSALKHEAFRIANFEKPEEIKVVKPVATIKNFVMNIGFDQETTQGFGRCLRCTFEFRGEEADIPEDAELGLVFTKNIQVEDWSTYRYLEFLYRVDFDESAIFYLQTDSKEILLPVLDFAKEKLGKNQWHEIRVDLDEFMKPEERQSIKALAFRFPKIDKVAHQSYRMYIDDIWLWQNGNMNETKVDASPPIMLGTPEVQIDENLARFNWKAAQEDLSGIAGYSYYFGPNLKQMPDDQVDVTTIGDEIEFKKPKQFGYYYFKVKALNHAGVWSNVIETRISVQANE